MGWRPHEGDDLKDFVEGMLDGFCGEVSFRREYDRQKAHGAKAGEKFVVHYTGFPMYQDQLDKLKAEVCECRGPQLEDNPCPHVLVKQVDSTVNMPVVELFAESIWGRSHAMCGTIFLVRYDECRRTKLVDPEDLPEELKRAVYEEQI